DTKLTVMTSYNRDSSGNVTTGTIQVDYSKTRLIDSGSAKTGMLDKEFTTTGAGAATASILTLDVTGATLDSTDFDDMLTNIEAALKAMSQGAAELGAAKSRIDMQKDFISKLQDSIDRGVGQLVDANMNKESTRLQ